MMAELLKEEKKVVFGASIWFNIFAKQVRAKSIK